MILSVVVPCFNEEEVLPSTIERLFTVTNELAAKRKIAPSSEILLIDDGSTDDTWSLIERFTQLHPNKIRGVKLSRNQGHQIALLAGLFGSRGDWVISVDADLQDDISAIEQMVDWAADGYDIVYGVRDSRRSDSFFKRTTAEAYYRLLRMMGVDVVFNHADFRLLSRRVIDALKGYREVNLFLRGIIPLMGFGTKCVFYERSGRAAGVSKYPLRKMVALALDGITSFSAFPLRLIMFLGLTIFVISMVLGTWALIARLYGRVVPGWTSTVVPTYFLGGVQLFSTGVLGEYLAKIYLEVKARPRYHIDKVV